jgi:hypothetical protein
MSVNHRPRWNVLTHPTCDAVVSNASVVSVGKHRCDRCRSRLEKRGGEARQPSDWVDHRAHRPQRRPEVIATTDVGEATVVSERLRGDQPGPANTGQPQVRARPAKRHDPFERHPITIRQIAAAGEAAWWIRRPIAHRHGRPIGIVVMADNATGSGPLSWLTTSAGLDAADIVVAPTCGSLLGWRCQQGPHDPGTGVSTRRAAIAMIADSTTRTAARSHSRVMDPMGDARPEVHESKRCRP